MTKTSNYHQDLSALTDWDAYLCAHSGLPGPRGNLELLAAAADLGTPELFARYAAYTPEIAPENTPGVFLALVSVVGAGRLFTEGDETAIQAIRQAANDPRWRMREGAAMALQRLGDANMERLLTLVEPWARGSLLEQRAAAAALCEPRLLKDPAAARRTLVLLDAITTGLSDVTDRRSDAFIALRKGLAYCWSVAVAALPAEGKPRMGKWLASSDKDIQWIMRENLKKNRIKGIF